MWHGAVPAIGGLGGGILIREGGYGVKRGVGSPMLAPGGVPVAWKQMQSNDKPQGGGGGGVPQRGLGVGALGAAVGALGFGIQL